jgi:transcriptional regulator with XRE-family HTH domain
MIKQIRMAIRQSGRTLSSLAAETGVGPDRLSRFLSGKRDLMASACDRLCKALGLRLIRAKRYRKLRGRAERNEPDVRA